jgi:hypothetical protein
MAEPKGGIGKEEWEITVCSRGMLCVRACEAPNGVWLPLQEGESQTRVFHVGDEEAEHDNRAEPAGCVAQMTGSAGFSICCYVIVSTLRKKISEGA